jgi:hypothetical protein
MKAWLVPAQLILFLMVMPNVVGAAAVQSPVSPPASPTIITRRLHRFTHAVQRSLEKGRRGSIAPGTGHEEATLRASKKSMITLAQLKRAINRAGIKPQSTGMVLHMGGVLEGCKVDLPEMGFADALSFKAALRENLIFGAPSTFTPRRK